jgi:hypothetical protein
MKKYHLLVREKAICIFTKNNLNEKHIDDNEEREIKYISRPEMLRRRIIDCNHAICDTTTFAQTFFNGRRNRKDKGITDTTLLIVVVRFELVVANNTIYVHNN